MFKKLPMYLQQETSECGYACVAMMASYFGHHIDISTLRYRFGQCVHGLSLYTMKSILTNLNLTTHALKVELDELVHVNCPVILHWNLDHFVVLKKVKNKQFVIHDPAIGVRVCDITEVSKYYTGIVLNSEPSEKFEKIQAQKKITMLDLARCLSGGRQVFLWVILASVLVESGQIIQALLMQYVTDSIAGDRNFFNVMTLSLGMLLVLIFFVGLDYLRGRVSLSVSVQMKTQFAINTMKHLLQLPLSYFEQRRLGQINLIFESIEVLQKQFGAELIQASIELILITLNAIVMFFYSPLLTLIVVLGLVCSTLLRYISMNQLKVYRQIALTHHGHSMSIFFETLQLMLPLKAYAKEMPRLSQWRHAYIEASNKDVEIASLELGHRVLVQLGLYIEYTLLICTGTYLVQHNQLSLGMLVAFLSFRLAFVAKSTGLIQRLVDYQLIKPQMERVEDLILASSEKQLMQTQSFAYSAQHTDSLISVEHLVFFYDKAGPPILDGLNFSVQEKERVAISGTSGCGKSTLLKLMMGLILPDHGEVYWQGKTLKNIDIQSYRQQIASVLQEDKLMSGSLLENILFFEEVLDQKWLEEVARIACIHDTIAKLPMRYETRLSEVHQGLSGGEKQRILLARALYKRPKILFLDEATSHLDPKTEQLVNASLKALDITQIIVAHRPETLAMADRVVTLKERRIQ